jgi:hypothetical protein
MKEEWRTVPGWDLYEVSNLGNLRGKKRKIRNNKGYYVRGERELHPVNDKYGYKTFKFKQGGNVKDLKIHRVVAMAFIPNPENKPCINHIDNNPGNNCVENLEWCTMQENTDWMIVQGRFKRTKEWLDHLHESQKPTYKGVIGTNIETGEVLTFDRLNGVREKGFEPSCVCVCCKHKNGITQHKGYRWEYAQKNQDDIHTDGSQTEGMGARP